MVADDNKLPSWFATFVLFFLLASVSVCSSQCVDGTYDHDGRKCCLCAVGWHLATHCTTNLTPGKCEPCETGWYRSVPNKDKSCERCTSCSHGSENLEEAEPCTPAKDRKCRCKKDHYCASHIDICRLCQPCKKCGEEGVKVPCTDSNDTVCNEKTEGGNDPGKTVGIILGVLFVIALLAAAAGVFCWKKRRPTAEPDQRNVDPLEEIRLVEDVDLQRHVHDIAEVIGWRDLERVATRSDIPTTVIESCKANHPNDVEEQTVQLLRIWMEHQGSKAPQNLIQKLNDINRKGKVEKVIGILSRDKQNPPV